MSTGIAGTRRTRPDRRPRPRGRRREQRGWYFYDLASSVFSTSVLTVFLGPYLTAIAKAAADADGFVHPLGIPVRAGSLFAYAVSVSIAAGRARDAARRARRRTAPGARSRCSRRPRTRARRRRPACSSWTATAICWAAFLLIVANASISVSMALYNAYLPQIATPDERDAVSSRGWAFGYTSGAFVLVLNLVLYSGHDSFGLSESDAVRICIASAGRVVGRLRPRTAAAAARPPGGTGRRRARSAPAGGSCGRRCATCAATRSRCSFLLAYLIYNDGIQTVISQASLYGSEELGLDQTTLITAVLLVQVLAVAGALGMGRLARVYGAKRTILGLAGRLDADPRRGVRPARRRAGVLLRRWRRRSGW